ncbi:hypothetical protein [Microbacterium sp.]|uniref:hypothetical protein n=1 Tax=Microbacterium sp. TaxID=51671 RepID=UPI0025F7F778|nr:hypothetical protein [Microbacterium sp.]
MSTPEQPATPALTRKQLRDIRNTGATPIVSGEAPPAEPATAAPPTVDPVVDRAAESVEEAIEAPVETPAQPVAAPLPRAAVPAVVHDLPGADASVDLGVSPLTRRQARQQERIRTASVPVITPEVAAAHGASAAPASMSSTAEVEHPAEPATDRTPSADVSLAQLFGRHAAASAVEEEHAAASAVEEEQAPADGEDVPAAHDDRAQEDEGAESDSEQAERAVVNPRFGAELLAGDVGVVELPPSFDQLISRSVTGAIGTGNALILSQTPSPPLGAPVAATGEVLITGSFKLPEGLGSTGHAPGTADGKEVDAVLVDGELPAHSSPTPIAASAAISTVKNGGDIIQPPTPEKGGRLMLTLAITAGVLALALVGVLILAFVTGVF